MQSAASPWLTLMRSAPLDSWIAFSADETRIVAVAPNMGEVVEKCDLVGETDVVLFKTPSAWGAWAY